MQTKPSQVLPNSTPKNPGSANQGESRRNRHRQLVTEMQQGLSVRDCLACATAHEEFAVQTRVLAGMKLRPETRALLGLFDFDPATN